MFVRANAAGEYVYCGTYHDARTIVRGAVNSEDWSEDEEDEAIALAMRVWAETRDDAEDRKRAEIRAAGLEWIKTAELSDDDVAAWEDRGLTYQDVREERRRRDAEAAEKSRTDEWAR
jgi:hypothetical protein